MSYELWTEEERAALKFACPYCHARKNKWCETWNREMRAKKLHKQRIENAKVNVPTVNRDSGGARVEVTGKDIEAFDVEGNKTFSTKPVEDEEVCHITCDYPVTGYHARRGGKILCTVKKVEKEEPKTGSEGFSSDTSEEELGKAVRELMEKEGVNLPMGVVEKLVRLFLYGVEAPQN